MKKKPKIVVVGSLNMDIVVKSPKLPVNGETILGEGYTLVPGGKGANQAVAASRLGADVTMFGCVGNDLFGKQLLTNLQNEGIITDNIEIVEDCPTGIAMIPVTFTGENFIVVSPGANMQLSPLHLEKDEEFIKNASVMLIQLEIPIDTVKTALLIAKKHNITTILNPAPAQSLPRVIYQLSDVITPNEVEGNLLVGRDVSDIVSPSIVIKVLKNNGVKNVLLTLGEEGVTYNEGNSLKTIPAHKVDVVDTTAAGDAINAGLAVGLAEGFSFTKAVDFAVKVAALTVTKQGAQTSLPLRNEVDQFGGSSVIV